MNKWNAIGFGIFTVIFSLATWQLLGIAFFANPWLPVIFVLSGIVLIGIEKQMDKSRYHVFVSALLWTGYWGIVTSAFFSLAGMSAILTLLGGRVPLIFFICSVAALFFGGLAIANFFRILFRLFAEPKLES